MKVVKLKKEKKKMKSALNQELEVGVNFSFQGATQALKKQTPAAGTEKTKLKK